MTASVVHMEHVRYGDHWSPVISVVSASSADYERNLVDKGSQFR